MAKYQIFRSAVNSQFYFRFVADNGKTIVASEGYTTKDNCKNGIAVTKAISPHESSYVRQNNIGNYRFNMVATNGQIVARSSEGYVNSYDRDHAINIMKSQGPGAWTEDLT